MNFKSMSGNSKYMVYFKCASWWDVFFSNKKKIKKYIPLRL